VGAAAALATDNKDIAYATAAAVVVLSRRQRPPCRHTQAQMRGREELCDGEVIRVAVDALGRSGGVELGAGDGAGAWGGGGS
jgi:hypothetical protein